MVIQDGLHSLLPLAAIVNQRVAQADPGAQIDDVIGGDPRLGQPSG
jgi:hypothetical protein